MAASDIGKLPRGAPAPSGGDGQFAAALGAGDSERVGTAPNGEPLYHAEWHRRPTDAQLAPYLPDRMPAEGWGLVACRTVERYRVEDCVELDDSPPGSRLAGAVRQAAWQFLVRPPRVGGKPLVGSWVRIRIEYSRSRS
jgi:protein TonB